MRVFTRPGVARVSRPGLWWSSRTLQYGRQCLPPPGALAPHPSCRFSRAERLRQPPRTLRFLNPGGIATGYASPGNGLREVAYAIPPGHLTCSPGQVMRLPDATAATPDDATRHPECADVSRTSLRQVRGQYRHGPEPGRIRRGCFTRYAGSGLWIQARRFFALLRFGNSSIPHPATLFAMPPWVVNVEGDPHLSSPLQGEGALRSSLAKI